MKRISTEIDRLQTMQRRFVVCNQFVSSIPTYKILRFPAIWFLLFFTLFFTACELPERDNPWDEKATIDAASWSADGFQIQDVNLTSKKLSWMYTGDNRIEGFQIDRKIGSGAWQERLFLAGKDQREWVDTSILPDTTKTYTYRLTAVAGTKKSNMRTGTVAVRFPGPTALSLQVGSDTTINLSWTYSSNGHEGFKIDRRKDNENWQLAYKFVNNTQTSVEDKFTSGSDYLYRIYAYYKEFNSTTVTDSLIFPKLTTTSASSITSATAISGGTVTRGTAITARGICWSTSQNPTVSLSSKTTDGSGLGTFVSSLSGLQPGTTYYVRAYATNSVGTAYGNQVSFTTTAISLPSLTTTSISNITISSASSGGTISSDGGAVVTARGVCWSTSQSPTESLSTKTINGSGTGSFSSSITGLQPGTTYYVRAYATNSVGTAYGNQVSFTTTAISLPSLTTTSISNITISSASSGGTISSDGGATVSARGVVWSTSQNPAVSLSTKTTDGSGTGSFSSSITGLQPGTTYYVRAYATNSAGTAYGSQLSFTTTAASTVSTVTSPTGKVWMDRNLGASRVATSSTDTEAYGDLYQWGRATDGHEKRTSQTTTTLSSSDTPGHGNFITTSTSPYDWRSPQNNNLWQGLNGTNNPCPVGFRIPTIAEWEAERKSWSSSNSAGAFGSPLKLPVAGSRSYSNGSLYNVGSLGLYWSGTVYGANAQNLSFFSGDAGTGNDSRAGGYSVRCLKD